MTDMRLCIGNPLDSWFKWLDAEEGSANVWHEIRKHAPEGMEEFIIVDHEGFGPVNPLELGITKAADFAEFIAGVDKADAILQYVGIIGTSYAAKMAYEYEDEVGYYDDDGHFVVKSVTRYEFEELEGKVDDVYRGRYSSKEEFAETLYDELGYLSSDDAKRLSPYVDWERVARDIELSGDMSFVEDDEGDIYAFWNH